MISEYGRIRQTITPTIMNRTGLTRNYAQVAPRNYNGFINGPNGGIIWSSDGLYLDIIENNRIYYRMPRRGFLTEYEQNVINRGFVYYYQRLRTHYIEYDVLFRIIRVTNIYIILEIHIEQINRPIVLNNNYNVIRNYCYSILQIIRNLFV
jgi:hypothetical protein